MERTVAAVHTHVLVQVAALGKLLPTPRLGTHKRPVARMRAAVNREGARDAERLVAPRVVALVRPLLRVDAHVLRQRRRLREPLRAHSTHIRAVARVRLDVPEHLLALGKRAPLLGSLAANPAALVLILAGAHMVIRNVLRKLGMRRKTLVAVLPSTRVLLLAGQRGGTQAGRS